MIFLPFKTLKYKHLWLFGNTDAENIRHVFFQATPALKINRLRGTFENPIGYIDQEKHVPVVLEKPCKIKLYGLYEALVLNRRIYVYV